MSNPLTNPEVLKAAADLLDLFPGCAPKVAAGIRLAEQWIRANNSEEEIEAIIAHYSDQAQQIADKWYEDKP